MLLTLDGAIFEASSVSSKSEGIMICKAANIVRKHTFTKVESFDGDLSTIPQKSSIPAHLIHLVGLILEGAKDYDSVSDITEGMALKLAQLIRFNSLKTKRRNESDKKRHSKRNEPPLPLLIGLSIHSQTRKKGIVENLASKGLSISYDRVIEIEDNITKQLCQKYNQDGIICPPSLQRYIHIGCY